MPDWLTISFAVMAVAILAALGMAIYAWLEDKHWHWPERFHDRANCPECQHVLSADNQETDYRSHEPTDAEWEAYAQAERAEKAADLLEAYPFVREDENWQYSRDTRVTRIRFKDQFEGYDHPWRRIKRWAEEYRFWRKPKNFLEEMGRDIAWKHPIIHAKGDLLTERHIPDGSLMNDGIIVFWEEYGEYIQLIQPQVGDLIAALLRAHPTLPEVQAVVEKILSIQEDYRTRVYTPEEIVEQAREGIQKEYDDWHSQNVGEEQA